MAPNVSVNGAEMSNVECVAMNTQAYTLNRGRPPWYGAVLHEQTPATRPSDRMVCLAALSLALRADARRGARPEHAEARCRRTGEKPTVSNPWSFEVVAVREPGTG